MLRQTIGLRGVPFLASLSDSELQKLLRDAVIDKKAAGESIIREDDYGDRMYVVETGAVQVWTKAFDGSAMILARIDEGGFFGEAALMPGGNGRRNASVRALEDSSLLSISRDSLLAALGENAGLLEEFRAVNEARDAFRSDKFRESAFTALNIGASKEAYVIEAMAAGETIFKMGDPGSHVYLVLSGRVRIEKEGTVLAEIEPGQFFGELAVLNEAPRSATAIAAGDTQLAALEGSWFRAAHGENKELRSLFDSLSGMYLLPQRGLVTLQNGTFDGKPCVTAIHNFNDGRRVVSTRLTGIDAFHSELIGVAGTPETIRFANDGRGISRELQVLDGHLVGIHSSGEWLGLGTALETLVESQPFAGWQAELFRQSGELQVKKEAPVADRDEILCTCTKTTYGKLRTCIAEGCHNLGDLAKKTGATLVCGGCVPLVKELLGRADWAPAKIVRRTPLAVNIQAFLIKPLEGECRTWLPGQHLVVQARIDGHTVQRAYTLSSAPGAEDGYEITVKREQGGVFSRWLFAGGDVDTLLRISEPGGHYYLPAERTDDVVCFAGGIGITPALSILRSTLHGGRNLRLHVDYSVSEEPQAVCVEEFTKAAEANPAVTFNLRETKRDGRLTAEQVAEIVARHPGALYFLCGSAPYMNSVEKHLRDAGVSAESIRIEHFHIAGAAPAAAAPAKAAGCPVDHNAVAAEATPVLTPIEEAKAFLRQFYAETGNPSVFEPRWQQVEAEFAATGTYRQTPEELTFCAQLAWRNAARCIGRLFWQGLAVRDFRHVTTSAGMLDAIMSHIDIATNAGNLRPTMTVFPPRIKGEAGPRVWNSQLFRYAGYRMEDGSVLGDPANLELTEVAIGLGWKPPAERTPFDLLPVIAQADGCEPEWREIPQELRLEVPIAHPDFPWFRDLGLKWYALPAVSCLWLDGGGIEYSAIPFNGWYMGTEIGARNFSDVQRYNLLPVIAKKMGLEMSDDRTLWKDRALVELNFAVLHSFEKAGVTMMDHHNASRAFNKFEEIENSEGRVVHANWSWIVPPISGSACTVFHFDHWKNIELKPRYDYQPDPWKLTTGKA